MTSPTHPPVPIAATAVVPPHVGSGPLMVLQLQRARVRIAVEMLTQAVQDLEACDCDAPVRQAACTALAEVVERQAALTPPAAPESPAGLAGEGYNFREPVRDITP